MCHDTKKSGDDIAERGNAATGRFYRIAPGLPSNDRRYFEHIAALTRQAYAGKEHQETWATRIGLSKSTISEMINCATVHGPRLSTLLKLANGMQRSPWLLLTPSLADIKLGLTSLSLPSLLALQDYLNGLIETRREINEKMACLEKITKDRR